MYKENKILAFIFILLFFFTFGQLIYYFILQPPKQANESLKETQWKVVDVLKLAGWVGKDVHSNLIIQNGALALDNTSGKSKDGYHSYNNRKNVFSIGSGLEASLQFYKKAGNEILIRFIAKLPWEETDWWNAERAIELLVLGKENNLYLKFFDKEKKIEELFFVGKLPEDGKITLEILDNKISVTDGQKKFLNEIFLKEKPFSEQISFGVTAGPNAKLEIPQFLVYLSPKS